jgi:hypothetical protein
MFPIEEQVNEYVKTELQQQVKEIFNEQTKTFDEKIKVQTVFVWLAVFFCLSCFVLNLAGVWLLVKQNIVLNNYIEHEMIISDRREQREFKKSERDSIFAEEYRKQMNHYESLPDYKER